MAWPEKLAVVAGLRANSSSTVEDPSVLSLCNKAPWFSLLPVTGPPGTRIPSGLPQASQDKPQVSNMLYLHTTINVILMPSFLNVENLSYNY